MIRRPMFLRSDDARSAGARRAGLRPQWGFTLIELMIVMAVMAILTSLAIASYQAQIVKSRRAVATGCLMGQVQYMERYYTNGFSYAGAAIPAGGCRAELKDFYTFTGDIQASSYTLTATPIGSQLSGDKRCMALSITDKGVKGKSGTATSVDDCW